MSRLIDADKIDFNEVFGGQSDFAKDTRGAAQSLIDAQPTVEAVPLKEVFRIIAGHSDYHGDSILSALKCITEGKEVKPIKPIEV